MSVESNVKFRLTATDQASGVFRQLQRNVEGVNGAFEYMKRVSEAALVGISIAKVWEGFRSVNDQIDQLGKSAQKIGLPVERLSELEYAAKLADVPFETLQTSMEKFDKGLSQAAATGKGTVAAAFKVMGLSILDANHHVKDQMTLLEQVSDRFHSYKDNANKTAIAMGLFGKAGAEIIPLMNGGGASIRNAAAELRSFGGVVNDQAVSAAEEFNGSMKRIHAALYSVAYQLVVAVTPAITELSKRFVDWLGKAGGAKAAANGIVVGFENIALASAAAVDAINSHMQQIKGFFSELDSYLGTLSNVNAWLKKSRDLTSEAAQATRHTLMPWTLYQDQAAAAAKAMDAGADSFARVGVQSETAQEKVKKYFDTLLAGMAAASGSARKYRDSGMGASSEAWLKATSAPPFDPTGGGRIKKDAALVDAKRIFDETRTAVEKYQASLANLDKLRARGLISQDTYNRAVTSAGETYLKALDAQNKFDDGLQKTNAYLDTFKSAVDDWLGQIVDGTFNAIDAVKSLAAQFAKLTLNQAFQALMGAGGGGNALYGTGGGGFFSGLAHLLGFASGGAILPTGGGGTDSQVVMFKKSPDERVDISRPGQTLTTGGGGQNIHFNIDARGADTARIAQMERTLAGVVKGLDGAIRGVVTREKAMNPGFAR